MSLSLARLGDRARKRWKTKYPTVILMPHVLENNVILLRTVDFLQYP